MKKFREGSLGAAEQKSNKVWAIVVAAIGVLVLLSFFAFNTIQHDLIKKAALPFNIVGFLMASAGFGIAAFVNQLSDHFDVDVKFTGGLAAVLVGIGLWAATGFAG